MNSWQWSNSSSLRVAALLPVSRLTSRAGELLTEWPIATRSRACDAGSSGRDALPRDPALYVSTAIFGSALRVRAGSGGILFFYLYSTCEPGSRGSASLPRASADHVKASRRYHTPDPREN